jgi:chaperonin GroES
MAAKTSREAGVDAMKLVPLGDKVAVRRLDAEEKTAGGIVLPDSAQEKPQQGRVLSVGDGHPLPDGTRVAHQVAEGDRVLFSRYAGTEVVVDDEEILIMNEDEILAVMD